ncbi:aspartate aminotransferase family protein, partial [Acinetobacter baumannii]
KGLMIGIQLDRPCMDITTLALEQNLLINVVANDTIRLLPALILTKTDADELVNRLEKTLSKKLETKG